MRFLLLGLVGSTITAQNATAWRWHRHSSEGSFVMSEVPLLPTSTDANRRLYGKTTVLRDTVYSLCTLRDTPGGSSVVLSLPPSVNLNLSGTVADGRQIALLTAYTTQGAFLWAAFFFADNADVGGADFIVDTLRQSLFVALAISAPTGPLSNLRAGYINGGLLTLSGIIGTIPTAAAAVVKVKGIGRPTPLFYAANWIQETTGNSSIFWASPYALVLQGEWIFLSGTFQLTNTGGYRAGHPPTLGVGSSDPTYPLAPTYYAFVMQFDTFALYGGHALIVRSHALPRAAYGRNLFRSGNNLIWLFSAEGPVLYYDWRDNTTGGANSFPLPYPGGIMKVLAWNLDAEDLSPSNTGQAILSYADGMAGEQAPPVFHSAWSGDTLTLLWSDSLDYQPIGGPFGAGGNRLHFGQWIHAAGQLTFHRYHFTPLYPHGQVPVALSLTGEGSERLFWTGTFSPAVPNALILTASSYAPLSPTNSARGYLAGLHWRAGSSEPRLTGLHPLWGGLTGGGRILWTGLDRDTYGHFYGWGFGSDTFLVWPTYPAGRDTAKGFGADRQNRYWVGRLDWYRLSSPTTLGSHCAPNIFGSPGMHTCYGSFPKDSAYIAVWMPEEVSRRYPLAHHWQAIGAWGIRWSSDIENPWHAPPFYALLGRVPSGRYFLTAVCGGPYLPDFVDVLDTVWMTVPGSTTPYLYEKNPDRLHFVSRLIGSEDPAYPLAHTGVYPMRQVRFEGNIVALASVPWQPFSGESFSEMLYLLEETTDSVRLYRANLTDQTLRVIRRWWRFTGVVTGSRDYGLDTVLAANTGGNIPAPYQLVWNPFSGRLLLGERSARIRAIDVYSANDEIVLGAQSGTSGTNSIGYRRRGGFRPFLGGVFTLNAEGQMRLFARNGVRTGLFQLTPDIRDSLLLRVGGNTLPGSPPCNGSGTQAQIGTILAASISRDTVWFVDRFSSGCGTPNRLLLRRAYPSSVDPRRDIVETWDTLAPSGSVQSLFYRPLPEPHFIISGNSVVIRYHIATRRIDTLWQCAAPSCCKYGISTASSALG
ncbi:MAG: hypothetical protein N2170_09730, partial [Bacteroidia bacterium]|nr:hypothetical protein [Bacteroidia bacterium]